MRRGDPAQEGEYVRLYGTGLGPVDTGLTPQALLSPMPCEWVGDGDQKADLAFAGLAPGLVGVYQVTVRMRDDLTTPVPTAALMCFSGTAVVPILYRVTP